MTKPLTSHHPSYLLQKRTEHRTVVRHVLWKGVFKASPPIPPNHGHLIPYRTPCCPAIVLALMRLVPRFVSSREFYPRICLKRPQAEKVEEVAILSTCGLRAVKVNYYECFSSLSPFYVKSTICGAHWKINTSKRRALYPLLASACHLIQLEKVVVFNLTVL